LYPSNVGNKVLNIGRCRGRGRVKYPSNVGNKVLDIGRGRGHGCSDVKNFVISVVYGFWLSHCE
jgi:hypothetical protein